MKISDIKIVFPFLGIFLLLNCSNAQKSIETVPNKIDTVSLVIDSTKNYQVIDGFGAFNTLSFWNNMAYEKKMDTLVNDLGLSIMRFELSPTYKETANGQYNIDGQVFGGPTIRDNFKDVRALKLRGVNKFIASVWSPPAWMKTLNSKGEGPTTILGGTLREDKYMDFADYCFSYCQTFKQETGLELYALGIQNEPEFVEPYNSCVYSPAQIKEVIKIVGKKFKSAGLSTKIYAPEVLPAQGNVLNFFNAVKNDPDANSNCEIFAIHNYDTDGINVGGASAEEWKKYSTTTSSGTFPKKLWMTETSGHPNTWSGAMLLAANMYNAINFGNINAWVWWGICDSESSGVFALIVDGKPSSRYYVSKHFYRFIRPGATRIKILSDQPDVLALAFKSSGEFNFVNILVNKGSKEYIVQIPAIALNNLQYYLTTATINCRKQQLTGNQKITIPAQSIMTIVWK